MLGIVGLSSKSSTCKTWCSDSRCASISKLEMVMARTLCFTSFPTHRRSEVTVCSARQDVFSAARNLARKRARHYKSSQPLFVDPYASALCNEQVRPYLLVPN